MSLEPSHQLEPTPCHLLWAVLEQLVSRALGQAPHALREAGRECERNRTFQVHWAGV